MSMIQVLPLTAVACAAAFLCYHAARIAYEDDIDGDRLHGCMFALIFACVAVLCVAYIAAGLQ